MQAEGFWEVFVGVQQQESSFRTAFTSTRSLSLEHAGLPVFARTISPRQRLGRHNSSNWDVCAAVNVGVVVSELHILGRQKGTTTLRTKILVTVSK